MNSITSITLSGLQGAQLRIGSAGHNIANALTPGFRRQVVAQQTVEGGGVATTIERAPVAGDALADDLVTLKLGEHLFKANLQVLRTRDRLSGMQSPDDAKGASASASATTRQIKPVAAARPTAPIDPRAAQAHAPRR